MRSLGLFVVAVVILLAPSQVRAEEAGSAPAQSWQEEKLPLEVSVPRIDELITRLETMHLETGDPRVAEELGALYLLRGQRQAGLRLLRSASDTARPVGRYSNQSGQTTAGYGTKGPGLPEGSDDLGTWGMELSKRKDIDSRTAGIMLLILGGRPAEAERLLMEYPADLPAHGWLKTLLLARTGQQERAGYTARQWADSLEDATPLALMNLEFVDATFPVSFGVYQELPGKTVSPGELALVYVQVMGARHQEDKNGFTVRFKVDYSIQESSGKVVWRKERPDIAGHTTRVPSRDLFLTSAFYVPMGLSAGQYSLRFDVTDLVAETQAAAATTFSVRER